MVYSSGNSALFFAAGDANPVMLIKLKSAVVSLAEARCMMDCPHCGKSHLSKSNGLFFA
jgi:transposase-like protein